MVKNNIFNQKKMDEFIKKYSDKLVINEPNKEPVMDWINRLNENSLVQEKQNYFNFRDIILNRILGYELEDIEFEHAHDDGRPVEFTLMKEKKEYAIIEAKGTKTDLDKRYGKQSAVEQATNYASVREDTKWAIVTNYEEIRLFNPSSREKSISFKFKELSDEKTLKEFLLTFSKFSLIEMDIPKKIMNETQIMEKDFEDEFYKLFSETRLMIIKELQYSGIEKIEAIRYSQLILDRFIFICFAEDINLLPAETTTETILTPIKHKNLFEFTIWERINELFRFVDKGNPTKNISGFNGGLFEENLRHLEIRDFIEEQDFYDDCKKNWKFKDNYDEIEKLILNYKNNLNPIYKNLLIMSSFDFESEVDVNILGHIFENSIGDIEELKDQRIIRRKKDGVFYTPEYVTDYICKNTIIPYLSKKGNINNIDDLLLEYEDNIEELDAKIRNIKIVDPACGSGAFLNKAADILLDIHERIFYKSDREKIDAWYDSTTERRKILLNNIYGVDVNEESVEITKLAMFLKVAKKGIKLPKLNENIKCGNSIIDDPKVVGSKAYNWKEQFSEIFENGGFDIVIGNPPYVTPSLGKKQKTLTQEEIDFLNKEYKSYEYKGNTFVIFIEKGLNLLKKGGMLGYITPNTLLTNYYFKNIREILLENTNIIQLLEITGRIFVDAEIGGNLITILKNERNNQEVQSLSIENYEDIPKLTKNNFNLLKQESFIKMQDLKFILDEKEINFLIKLKDMNSTLADYATFYNGIKTGNNKKFLAKNKINNQYVKILRGKDIFRYTYKFDDEYVLFDPKQLWSNHDETKFKVNEKIIVRQTSDKIIGAYDNNKYFTLDSTHLIIPNDNISTKFLLGVVNSKLINFYYQKVVPEIGKAFAEVKIVNLEKLPIKLDDNYERNIVDLVNRLELLYSEITDLKINFRFWLDIEFEVGTITSRNNLYNFWEYDLKEFIKIFKKKNGKITSTNLKKLSDEFNETVTKIDEINEKINLVEIDLNNNIYKMYKLTEEEIKIIEDDD